MTDGLVIPTEQLAALNAMALDWIREHWYLGDDHECPHCNASDWSVAVASLQLVQAICKNCAAVVLLDGGQVFRHLEDPS